MPNAHVLSPICKVLSKKLIVHSSTHPMHKLENRIAHNNKSMGEGVLHIVTYTEYVHTYTYMVPPKPMLINSSCYRYFIWDEAHPQNLLFILHLPSNAAISNLLTHPNLHVFHAYPLSQVLRAKIHHKRHLNKRIPTRTLLRTPHTYLS